MVLKYQSEITIGSFKFKRVNEVVIKRHLHSYIDTALIKIPSVCRIKKKDGSKSVKLVNTSDQFKDGDAVTIKLGANGKLREEFRGFVKRRNLNIPLEIECEGYSYLMRKGNNIKKLWKKEKISTILKDAMGSLPITLKVDPNSDIELMNIAANDADAAAVLDLVLRESKGALNAFFIEPDVLWVGLVYVPMGDDVEDILKKPQVKYALGKNTIKDNDLKQREPDKYEVIIHTKKTKRETSSTTTDVAKKVLVLLSNHIGDSELKKIKDVLVKKETYKGYDGRLTSFIFPECEPGFKAYTKDTRYKERDGNYLVRSVETKFGQSGCRRRVELGPKISN